ncbi:LRR receptor-like serine/threonine-protein kinase FLS2 [Vigna unguiculata]|uniref:LRR receptor-like serine/threonine-protein kinase FLS2 n=2 Tax=Vigna unguiculata TaxID=3917 RepID=A0A4D6LTN5_VIGUN|nr:LRR receptor-like serine/threonine-protein kinase FLS2 [Vigna unguiculata]
MPTMNFFLSALLLHSFVVTGLGKEASHIIMHNGGAYPYASPPPPMCPPPPPPPCQTRLQRGRETLVGFTGAVDRNKYIGNWRGSDPCNFKGIRCAQYPDAEKQRAIAGIDLNGAGLSGKNRTPLLLSGILDRIPELTFFHSNSNNFTGAIPTEITKYEYFFELDLSNNKLKGEFPKEVLQSSQLVFLDLRFNGLYGPIPPQLFNLKYLDVIFINNNQFSGTLPDAFGSTPARYLTFANNQLTGPIPASVGASKNLVEVLFLGNHFEGCLPYQIGLLRKATVFDVSQNWLTGPIPRSFGCLESIRYLNLEKNHFYGEVPETVCELPGLRDRGNFSLSNNYFTQVGPACRRLIDANVLDVTNNCILGLPNQRPHGECSHFFSNLKPCPNPKSLNYVPCKKYIPSSHTQSTTSTPPPPPLSYNSLDPHLHR